MSKPKVGIFGFTGCGGCQLEILNLEDQLLDLVAAIDLVHFTEAITEHSDNYDIALVEGAITTRHGVERIEKIGKIAKIIVAIGSCAVNGGLNCLKNLYGTAKAKELVYGDKKDWIDSIDVKPVDAYVKVDYYARGCPPNRFEIVDIIRSLIVGRKPEIPNYPVCVECKRNGNTCVFELGMTCLGPVTRAGCNSRCPNSGSGCDGCRGLIDEPNVNAQKDLLKKYGLTVEDMVDRFNLYNACREKNIAEKVTGGN
ncbi:MAG: NADH:ubiquinone oxidoreductase [Actinobacteria bacterium]|nr:NADH:ubiquinone oxidoreductase [Actinomycetota bacterium]